MYTVVICLLLVIGGLGYKYGYIQKFVNKAATFTDQFYFRENQIQRDPEDIISTNNFDFSVKYYDQISLSRYGGIDLYQNKIIFVDGAGSIFHGDRFEQVGQIQTENNEKQFTRKFGMHDNFSIKDIFIKNSILFYSSVIFDPISNCFNMGVFSVNLQMQTEYNKIGSKLFETEPCFGEHKDGAFMGTSAGGRISVVDDYLYLTVGDFYFDGVNDKDITGVRGSDYGKLISFNLLNKKKTIKSKGLRNAQGLVNTPHGLYSSEHGPQGGDEINRTDLNQVNQLDFGWPNASYGVDYGTTIWPSDPSNNNHSKPGITKPKYFFIPSIGISSLDYIPKDSPLTAWQDSLITSSLREESLYISEFGPLGELISMEQVYVENRVRDVKYTDESIYILIDAEPTSIMRLRLKR